MVGMLAWVLLHCCVTLATWFAGTLVRFGPAAFSMIDTRPAVTIEIRMIFCGFCEKLIVGTTLGRVKRGPLDVVTVSSLAIDDLSFDYFQCNRSVFQ